MMPPVTIITPITAQRMPFLERLRAMVAAQDYTGNIEYLLDWDGGTIGEKRNRLCEQAKGDIILHVDSDDLYHAEWVTHSVQHLLQSGGDMTGLSNAYFASNDQAWLYEYAGSQPYALGSSMCYYKSAWERTRFLSISNGEDRDFCGRIGKVRPHTFITGFLATIHGNNTASHNALSSMQRVDYGIAQGIVDSIL